VVRASKAPYVVFGLILGGLAVFSFVIAWVAHPPFWKFGAVLLALYAFTVTWLRSVEVKVDAEGIASGSLFGTRSLRWEEIDRAEIRLGYRPKYEQDEPGHAFKAPFRLVIFPDPLTAKPPVRIEIKLLSRADLQKLVERLEASLAGCKISGTSWMAPVARG